MRVITAYSTIIYLVKKRSSEWCTLHSSPHQHAQFILSHQTAGNRSRGYCQQFSQKAQNEHSLEQLRVTNCRVSITMVQM